MTAGQASRDPSDRPDPPPPERIARAAGDRRSATRVPPPPARGRSVGPRPSGSPVAAHYLIAREWWLVAPLMLVCLGLAALATRSLPPAGPLAVTLVALGIPLLTRRMANFERARPRRLAERYAAMLAVVATPMLAYGIAVAWWIGPLPGAPWDAAVGALAIAAAVSAILCTGRLPAMVAAQTALWLGACAIEGSGRSLASLVLGMGIGMVAVLRQMRLDRAAAARQRDMERTQVRAEEILSDYEQTGQGWFWETDRRGALTYVSAPIADIVGRTREDLIGRPLATLFVLDSSGHEGERTLSFHLSARSPFADLAVRAATGDEVERWWSISGRPIYDHFDNYLGFRGSGSDLTERRRSEEHASRLAHYDSLTGLANRFQMSQTLEKILNARQAEHRDCAVFLLDLDRFKQVNDTMGHPAGDALLKQVAQRLARTVDTRGRVGRLGGDEFQVILPGRTPRRDLAQLAERIIETLSQPYSVEGHRVVIGASVGIALCPDDGVTSEALIRNADLALYAAKDGGRGRLHFYAADLHSDAEERRQLEQDLRDAIAHGGLELYYQPVVHTTTERITGFEALLRWNHPVRGPVSPGLFIPIAEDAGLIAQIGEWALRTACADLARWPESVRVAVNVSPLQFANPALPAIVTSALAAAQVNPARLELELTESVFLNDSEGTDAMFAALKGVGVRLALDDFGTGYSSLGYLKKAPFDRIKIDQSFVRRATERGSRNGAIIAAIVSLAEALGMETTAEGVETLDELDLVRTLGCSHVQGFIYEKPLSGADVCARLAAGLGAVAEGPRSARATRQTMLRKVVMEHGGERYDATIRNISATGALVEGLWNVPPGTIFRLSLSDAVTVTATARWSQEDRMGVEFALPLALDETGRIAAITPRPAGQRPARTRARASA